MNVSKISFFVAAAVWLAASSAAAQYNASAGSSAPMVEETVQTVDRETGEVEYRKVRRAPEADRFGNAQGTQFDLAVDGAFEGQTIAVLHFYTAEGFDFSLPKAALAQKGFSVYRWLNGPPTPKALEQGLAKACQLWIISSDRRLLNAEHLKVIKAFFDSGRGVYIWGDNQPYYADANYVAEALFGTHMAGNLIGDQPVTFKENGKISGLKPNHLLTTGLQNVYEGITIATIEPNQQLTPLIHGSAGNLVAAFYDRNGKRAILDGGFTRLFYKWDTAGTPRYVKNAAAWLVNVERFGDEVVSVEHRTNGKGG